MTGFDLEICTGLPSQGAEFLNEGIFQQSILIINDFVCSCQFDCPREAAGPNKLKALNLH